MITRTTLFCFLCIATLVSRAQVKSIEKLEKEVFKIPEDTNRVNKVLELTELLWKNSQDTKALEQANYAYTLSKELNFQPGIGFSLIQQSILLYRKSDYKGDLKLLAKATALFEELKNKKGLALAYNGYGNVYYAQSQLEKALDYYLKSLKLREQTGDKQGIAYSLYNIANIYKEQNQNEKALEYHLKSLEIKKEISDTRGIAYSYNNIATIYSDLKQYSKSLGYYLNAIKIFEELGNSLGQAYTLGNIGEVYQKQNQYNRSIKYLLQAEALFKEIGDNKALSEADNKLANAHLQLHHYGEAKQYLDQARELALKSNINEQLIENYLLLARLDSAQGNFSLAFDVQKKYTKLKEAIFTLEKSKQIARIQSTFEDEKKNQQITLLNKEKALQLSEEKNQRTIFLFILALFVTITFGLLYFLQQNHKTNVVLAVEKERSEELNRLKDRLLSILSHDLRSPFNSLRGLLHLAENGHLTDGELKTLLVSIRKNTHYVTELLENLLGWAKSHLNNEKINIDKFQLEPLVLNNIELLQQQATEKNIQLVNNISTLPLLSADKNMIDIVLRNLLSNAIKFTPRNGEVSISTMKEDRVATIAIQDNGVGISEEQKTKLLGNINYSTPGTLNEKGTGLGLILCREFIEKNNGKLWFESTPLKGTVFYFTLPLEAA